MSCPSDIIFIPWIHHANQLNELRHYYPIPRYRILPECDFPTFALCTVQLGLLHPLPNPHRPCSRPPPPPTQLLTPHIAYFMFKMRSVYFCLCSLTLTHSCRAISSLPLPFSPLQKWSWLWLKPLSASEPKCHLHFFSGNSLLHLFPASGNFILSMINILKCSCCWEWEKYNKHKIFSNI